MTPDEIILMADASSISLYGMGKDRAKFIHYLEAFAKLVAEKAAAKEREACAKLLESRKTGANDLIDAVRDLEAQAIRARK